MTEWTPPARLTLTVSNKPVKVLCSTCAWWAYDRDEAMDHALAAPGHAVVVEETKRTEYRAGGDAP